MINLQHNIKIHLFIRNCLKIISCCTILLFQQTLLSQTQSERGNFQLDEVTGCAPFTVTPDILFQGNFSVVQYRYDNTLNPLDCSSDYQLDPQGCTNGNDTADPSFTFNSPGTYYILQIIATQGGNPEVDFIEVQVLEPIEPEFTVSLCAGNEVSLNINSGADQYNSYEIDFGDGTVKNEVSTGASTVVTHTYTNQGDYDISISGKLNDGVDVNCGISPTQRITTLDIIPVPSITQLVNESINTMVLRYETLNRSINYVLQLNTGSGFQNMQSIDPTQNPNELTISDNAFDNANASYTFRIVASDPCGGEVISNQASSIGINYQLVDITNSINITYSWTTNQLSNSMAFVQNGATLFSTTDLSGSRTEAYSNCISLSSFYMEKTIGSLLIRSLTLSPFQNENLDLPAPSAPNGALVDNNIELTFASPPFAFDQIEVFRKDDSGSFSLIGSSNSLSFTDFGVSGNLSEACYLIRYIDACGNESLQSLETCIPLDGQLMAPNAFSPNGDGINDTFEVGSGVFTDFQLLIFNKWGILVYQGNDPTQGWDGNVNGEEAPVGTYQYKIMYLKNGLKLITTGTVTLIR